MENLRCAICVDVFRDPVALPCKHNFCRECLQMFADKSMSARNDNGINSPTCETDVQVTILCPVCRIVTNLGKRGVAGLPVNSEMAINVGRAEQTDTCTSTGHMTAPLCSMCDDEKLPAVQFCATCVVLYCDQCLPVMHPMKGPLKRHSMISVSEYLNRGQDNESLPVKTVAASLMAERPESTSCEARLSCDKHPLLLSMFCLTCQHLICIDCLRCHNNHQMSDIESAFQTLVAPFQEKSAVFEDLITKLEKCVAETVTLRHDVQANQDCHLGEVDRAYNRGLEALESWKRKEVKDVEKRHSKWFSVCDEGTKHLQIKIDEGKTLVARATQILSTPKAVFVRDSGHCKSEVQTSISAYSDVLNKLTADNKRCHISMQRYPANTKCIVVPGLFDNQLSKIIVSTPSLRFEKTSCQELKIQEDGLMITTASPLGKRKSFTFGAVTDGLLKEGRFYWEIDVPYGSIGKWECVLGVGNQHRLEEPSDKYKYVTNAIGLKCVNDKYTWLPYCKATQVNTHEDTWKACERIERFGVYLDTYSKIMIFIDCCRNQVFGTMKHLNVSSPFVPAISLLTGSSGVSVHLISQPVLPQVLCDKLGELAAMDTSV